MVFLLIKWLHTLAFTLLIGAGAASAFYVFVANRTRDTGIMYFAAKYATTLNRYCLLPSAVMLLIHALIRAAIGQSVLLAIICGILLLGWVLVARAQTHMRNIVTVALVDGTALPTRYWSSERLWCITICLLLAAQLSLLSLKALI